MARVLEVGCIKDRESDFDIRAGKVVGAAGTLDDCSAVDGTDSSRNVLHYHTFEKAGSSADRIALTEFSGALGYARVQRAHT